MSTLYPQVDPDGLLEYSVVFTDRALNHMSREFQGVMTDISALLRECYQAHAVAIVPGGGTYGMEAVARQFATGRKCLVIRNGWFSYRWTQIFDMGQIPSESIVLKAARTEDSPQAPYAPAPVEEVVARIHADKPDLVFAPHVETASGMLLPDNYLKQVADAVHAVGGLFVLDCVASGAIWVNMAETGVDLLISAPQKGWSSTPSSAMVMMSERARQRIDETQSTSFACDLRRWLQIMEAYLNGGHAYHATMPTGALKQLRDTMKETRAYGFEKLRERQWALGQRVRELFAVYGFQSVAAPGFEAPGVVVSYTDDSNIQNVSRFIEQGIQAAAGVPLMCDEPEAFKSFRVGLFGLDKWRDVDRAVVNLEGALQRMGLERVKG